MTGCECPEPGWCPRHGVEKSPHLHHLCQHSEKYWRAWEAGRGPRQAQPQRKPDPQPQGGPGTELSKILKRFGIEYVPGCKCADHARTMDRWGPDGCEKQMQTILFWLRQESEKRGLPFVEFAAKMLVRRAIKRAKQT